MFTMDRVQYSTTQKRYYIFQFIQVPNVSNILNNGNLPVWDEMWNNIFKSISGLTCQKYEFIRDLPRNIKKYLIIYNKNKKLFFKEDYILVESVTGSDNWTGKLIGFNDLQKWFRALNSIDGKSGSKGLGAAKESDTDSYVNGILGSIYNTPNFLDDNGLWLTKLLLNGDTTKGFDFDLFQYIPSTQEYVIYEFLKRENKYLNNLQAHPMRYCWTGNDEDNKKKFISLWNAKVFFNARLILINYSDFSDEKVSISEITNFDEQKGILAEDKYSMSGNVLFSWLLDMSRYSKNHNNYLSDFKKVTYSEEFFEDFGNKKRQYGSEFYL